MKKFVLVKLKPAVKTESTEHTERERIAVRKIEHVWPQKSNRTIKKKISLTILFQLQLDSPFFDLRIEVIIFGQKGFVSVERNHFQF